MCSWRPTANLLRGMKKMLRKIDFDPNCITPGRLTAAIEKLFKICEN